MFLSREEVSAFDFRGLSIRDYTAGLEADASLAVITVPPGARHPAAYSSRSTKYYLVADGSVRFVVDGQHRDLEGGDFCMVPPMREFSYENLSSVAATLVLVHTPPFDPENEIFVEEGPRRD